MDTIALFSDTGILPGLHVTLYTLLETWPEEVPVRVHVFADEVSDRDKDLLRKTHAACKGNSELVITDFSPKRPSGGNTLHGNETSYGRLHLGELLPDCDRCLYLDCDLIIRASLKPIFDLFDGEHTLLVEATPRVKHELMRDLYVSAGMDPEDRCFNSGIIGMDLKRYRDLDGLKRCHELAWKYRDAVKGADQALLNLAFHGDFKSFDPKFNFFVFPWDVPPADGLEDKVYHLLGAPKPWDFGGMHLNKHGEVWKEYLQHTALAGTSLARFRGAYRTFRISRSLLRAWKRGRGR